MEKKIRTSEMWVNKIKVFEGLRLYRYRCPAGYYTIGYGHRWHAGEPLRMSEATATEYLLRDIAIAEDPVRKLEKLCGGFTDGQFDALTDFVFNLGATAFKDSTLYRVILCDKNSQEVGVQIKAWRFANGRVLPGLYTRRCEEVRRYYE